MQFFARLLRPLASAFRRSPANENEPEAGASSTLELSRTDIEVLDVVWERY